MVDRLDRMDQQETGGDHLTRSKSSGRMGPSAHGKHQRRCRRCSLMPMAARNVCTFLVCIWATNVQHQTTIFDAGIHLQRSPTLVQAFSDGWSSRQLHYSSRASIPKQGSMHLKSTTTLMARSNCPTGHAARSSFSALDHVPCRKSVFWGRNTQSNSAARSEGKSLLICGSTISDETAIAETKENETIIEINVVNGANGVNGNVSTSTNGVNGHGSITTNGASKANGVKNGANGHKVEISTDPLDIPTPTAAGGYSHTASSRAKISAANKGKTAWNKGIGRSEETKARIAEGVRRKNRERFLAKLEDEGITEEEFNERKKAERRKKDAERRARKTAKGGYTPTEATKQKISKILKERYASGDIKRKPRDPSKVRRGFKHTEETKQKIRESLRRKWADDEDYRELMTNKTVASGNVDPSIRQRISETLKKRWEEPEFRAEMLKKLANRKHSSGKRDQSHRQKISEAMKKKWMDEEYRRRATEGMAKGRESAARVMKPVQPKMPKKRLARRVVAVKAVAALSPKAPVAMKREGVVEVAAMKKSITKGATTKVKRKKAATKKAKSALKAVKPIDSSTKSTPKKKPSKKKEATPEDGSISRLREERRDLYDLLYGDEDEDKSSANGDGGDMGPGGNNVVNGDSNSNGGGVLSGASMMAGVGSNTMAALMGDDDDLDDFDPYGLHDTAPTASAFKQNYSQ